MAFTELALVSSCYSNNLHSTRTAVIGRPDEKEFRRYQSARGLPALRQLDPAGRFGAVTWAVTFEPRLELEPVLAEGARCLAV
ncbi:hypothetical protein ACSMXN_14100 [Jatrophihabitans sp. DSM 45814]